MTSRPRAATAFSALDWIGFALTCLLALGVAIFPRLVGPFYAAMFEDFGAELPTITRLAFSGWLSFALAALIGAPLLLGTLPRIRLGLARLLVVLAFLIGLGATGFYWLAFNAPIFELAEAIEADPPTAEAEPIEPPLDPPTRLPGAPRIVAIGDLHGDLAATRRALRLAGAIDEDDRWSGGDLVVVQTGDVLDRGDEERAIMDLLERLATEAQSAGGRLLTLNGNHEVMNVNADLRYVFPPGFSAFQDFPSPARIERVRPPPFPARIGGRITAFAPGGAYAIKLAANNIVQLVGDTLFVHGSVLPVHVEHGLDRINRETRAWMRGERDELPSILATEDAPIWDRSFSLEDVPTDCALLGEVLAAASAARMVVGHEVQRDGITSACEDRVWRIDVGLGNFYGGPTEVLEIRGRTVEVLPRPAAQPDSAPSAAASATP